MKCAESAEHKNLKRLALAWAHANGYRIAAAEVSLPNYRFRLDVAAYRPDRVRSQTKTGRSVWQPAVGITAVFECKVSTPDFRRDAQSISATMEQLKKLHERKARIEQELRLFYPSIRNGDSLFQEFETVDFERPGHERYQRTLTDITRLVSRLHANTKFDDVKPILHELDESGRLSLLHRISLAATRAVNREHDVPFTLIASNRALPVTVLSV